jgi:hypothetical protein
LILSHLGFAQLSNKFPPETMGYKPVGKADCNSLNMAGMPPMNTCSQKYSNQKLTITITLTEYTKGNPTIVSVGGNDQGDDPSVGGYFYEKIIVGRAKGSITFMKNTKIATASMAIDDKIIIDINGANQPNIDAVKALAKAMKL